MKKLIFPFLLLNMLLAYNITQFVTCKDVNNLSPVQITNTFTTKDSKVFAFAYFKNIKKNQTIDFVWEKNVKGKWKLYADIKLPIFSGYRWRTYSNITIRPFFNGKWKVSIIENNKTVKSIYFTIKELNETD